MKELLLGWRVRVLAALCLGLAALSGSAWSAVALDLVAAQVRVR